MNRLPGLDRLHALAILWVMLFHAWVAGLGSPLPTLAAGPVLKDHGAWALVAYSSGALAGVCLLYGAVERPILRLRDRQRSTVPASLPAAA